MRDVALAEDPPVRLTRRAVTALAEIRDAFGARVAADGTVVEATDKRARWWTWGGFRTNLTLQAIMRSVAPGVLDGELIPTDQWIQLSGDLPHEAWQAALAAARTAVAAGAPRRPEPDDRATRGLKFSAALPDELARDVLAARLADQRGARDVLDAPVRWEHLG